MIHSNIPLRPYASIIMTSTADIISHSTGISIEGKTVNSGTDTIRST